MASDLALLIRACLWSGDAGRDACRNLIDRAGQPKAFFRTQSDGVKALLPLLFAAARNNSVKLEAGFATYLKTAAFHEEARHAACVRTCVEVLDRLKAAEVTAVVLGGLALAETAYPEAAQRHSYGLDLLLGPADIAPAARALENNESKPIGEVPWRTLHSSGIPIVLAERPLSNPRSATIARNLIDSSVMIRIGGAAVRTLSSTDQVFLVLGSAQVENPETNPTWICDLWHLLANDAAIDWRRVLKLARWSGKLEHAERALQIFTAVTGRKVSTALTRGAGGRVDKDSQSEPPSSLRRWNLSAAPTTRRSSRLIYRRGLTSFDQELILRASLCEPLDAVDAWELWRARNSLDSTDAGSRRLLPLTLHNLRKGGYEPLDALELQQIYLQSRADNLQRLRELPPILSALEDKGIEAMVLKGASLLAFYHRDPALRPMNDLDILVPTHAARQAVDVLLSQGFTPVQGISPDFVKRMIISDNRIPGWGFEAAGRAEIDLHWHVLHDNLQTDADDDFWRDSRFIDLEGSRMRALSPADLLLHVCVHGLRPDPVPPIRWVADAHAIIERSGGELSWQRLVLQAARRRLLLQVLQALDYLKREFKADVPEAVLAELKNHRVSLLERLESRARLRVVAKKPVGLLAFAVEAGRCARQGSPLGSSPRSLRRAVALIPHHWGMTGWKQMFQRKLLLPLPVAVARKMPFATQAFRCFDRETVPVSAPVAYQIGSDLDFRSSGSGERFLCKGWSWPEPIGTWTDGPVARLTLQLENLPEAPLRLVARLRPFVSPLHPVVMLEVLINGTLVARWRFTIAAAILKRRILAVVRGAKIPDVAMRASSVQTIDFRILHPASPYQLGLSADARRLGVMLSSLRLEKASSASRVHRSEP